MEYSKWWTGRASAADHARPAAPAHRPRADLRHSAAAPRRVARHAQAPAATEQGRWLLQDLRSRNHVYVDNKAIQQVVLEPRQPFRIADYWPHAPRGAPRPDPILERSSSTTTTETTSGADPGWLEQLQVSSALSPPGKPARRAGTAAREFRRNVQPRVVAIGLVSGRVHLGRHPAGGRRRLADVRSQGGRAARGDQDASSIQTWSSRRAGRTPARCAVVLLFPMKGRAGVIGPKFFLSQPSATPVPSRRCAT